MENQNEKLEIKIELNNSKDVFAIKFLMGFDSTRNWEAKTETASSTKSGLKNQLIFQFGINDFEEVSARVQAIIDLGLAKSKED